MLSPQPPPRFTMVTVAETWSGKVPDGRNDASFHFNGQVTVTCVAFTLPTGIDAVAERTEPLGAIQTPDLMSSDGPVPAVP